MQRSVVKSGQVRSQASPSSLFLCRRDLFVSVSYTVAEGRRGVTRAFAYLQQQKQAARQSQRPTMNPVRPMKLWSLSVSMRGENKGCNGYNGY